MLEAKTVQKLTCFATVFKDTQKAFDDFKNKQKSVDVKKIFFGKNKRYKICPLFSFANSNFTVLFLICNFYMS